MRVCAAGEESVDYYEFMNHTVDSPLQLINCCFFLIIVWLFLEFLGRDGKVLALGHHHLTEHVVLGHLHRHHLDTKICIHKHLRSKRINL